MALCVFVNVRCLSPPHPILCRSSFRGFLPPHRSCTLPGSLSCPVSMYPAVCAWRLSTRNASPSSICLVRGRSAAVLALQSGASLRFRYRALFPLSISAFDDRSRSPVASAPLLLVAPGDVILLRSRPSGIIFPLPVARHNRLPCGLVSTPGDCTLSLKGRAT